jgi:hypothetical protein
VLHRHLAVEAHGERLELDRIFGQRLAFPDALLHRVVDVIAPPLRFRLQPLDRARDAYFVCLERAIIQLVEKRVGADDALGHSSEKSLPGFLPRVPGDTE